MSNLLKIGEHTFSISIISYNGPNPKSTQTAFGSEPQDHATGEPLKLSIDQPMMSSGTSRAAKMFASA